MSVQDMAHSPLGPSSAERWINCPGSVRLTKDLADVTSEFAAEGIFAHYISELARTEGKDAKEYLGLQDHEREGDFVCDAEMVTAVQSFLDYVGQFECEEELIEARVNFNAWVDGGFGTLDAGLLNDGTCIIIDLKYGKGIQVFAERNFQMMCYALGVYQEHGHLFDITKFKLCIHQPRLNHVDEWEISIEELLTWAEEVLEPAADRTADPDAPLHAGKWCQWCKIRATCNVRADMVKDALLDEIQDIRDPNEMGDDGLGEAASLIPLMRSWCNDVMNLVEKKVTAGESIIGEDGLPFKMVEGRANRIWTDAKAVEKSMRGYKLKVDEIFTKKLITPPVAEKLLGKDHHVLKTYVTKPQGKPVLVAGSDKREAFKVSTTELDDLDG